MPRKVTLRVLVSPQTFHAYVDFSGKHLRSWAACVVKPDDQRELIGGLLPGQGYAQRGERGELSALQACEAEMTARSWNPAVFYSDDALTARMFGATLLTGPCAEHQAAHDHSRAVREAAEELTPDVGVQPERQPERRAAQQDARRAEPRPPPAARLWTEITGTTMFGWTVPNLKWIDHIPEEAALLATARLKKLVKAACTGITRPEARARTQQGQLNDRILRRRELVVALSRAEPAIQAHWAEAVALASSPDLPKNATERFHLKRVERRVSRGETIALKRRAHRVTSPSGTPG